MPRHADPALPARRRAQILAAARACFHARGFHETTVEEICAEARVSPGALYRYFDAKADIIAAIALDARSEAEPSFLELEAGDALVDALAEMARAFFAAFEAEAPLLTDIWAEAARDAGLARALARRDEAAKTQLAAAITRAARAGAIYPALSPEDAAETLLAALEGLARRRTLHAAPGFAVILYRTLALHVLKPKR